MLCWLDVVLWFWSDGDFVLLLVGVEDVVWGFGFYYEGMYCDEDVCVGFSCDGYLLIVLGIGLGNLVVLMIWLVDGCYLVLIWYV